MAALAALLRDEAVRLRDADRPRRRRQDPAGPGGGERLASAFADGAAFVAAGRRLRRPPTRSCPAAIARGARGPGAATVDPLAAARCAPSCATGDCCWCSTTSSMCVAAAPLLADLLAACPRLTILVTSRTLLRLSGERDCPGAAAVPALRVSTPARSPPPTRASRRPGRIEAVRLFVERARAAAPGFALTAANARGGRRRSAAGWTGCRWRSSWPPPAAAS